MPATILAIEDEFPILDTIYDILNTAGYQVKTASNGDLALKLAFEEPLPDLILCDINMPDKNGYQIIEEIALHSKKNAIPVIFISGRLSSSEINKAKSFGVVDYIKKPFTVSEILSVVETHFKKSRKNGTYAPEKLIESIYYDEKTGLNKSFLLKNHLNQIIEKDQKNFALQLILVNQTNNNSMLDLNEQESELLNKLIIKNIEENIHDNLKIFYLTDTIIAVVITNNDKYLSSLIATEIIKSISQPIKIGEEVFELSSNIGISLSNSKKGIQSITHEAEIALKNTKQTGINTFSIYQKNLKENDFNSAKIQNQLFNALRNNELKLMYLPKVNLFTNKICGLEALLRWNTNDYGHVPPSTFIPIAESNGMIKEIGIWVIEEVMRQLIIWFNKKVNLLPVSINISFEQLNDNVFTDIVNKKINSSSIGIKYIEFELTESIFSKNPKQIKDALHSLKSLGLRLSLDDFRNLYSSLSFFKDTFDVIKIDNSLTDDILINKNASKALSGIIASAKDLDFTVIAEGVEKQAQAHFYRKNKCDEMQGFLFCKPIEAKEIQQLYLYT